MHFSLTVSVGVDRKNIFVDFREKNTELVLVFVQEYSLQKIFYYIF